MQYGAHRQGTKTLTGATNTAVLAAPGTGDALFVTKAMVSVSVFAASGKVALDDGTNTLWKVDVAADENGGSFLIDFGDKGYRLGNLNLRMVATGAITCHCTAIGYVLG
jgi:hypothetical protein